MADFKILFGGAWYRELGEYLDSPDFLTIGKTIAHLRKQGREIIPFKGSDLLFKAFRTTPYDKVKVIILGQDVYHTIADDIPVYDGLAFSNSNSIKPQPSLANILKEVEDDIYDGLSINRVTDFSLYSWAEQGVLLINVAHTVEVGKPGSHLKLWEPFTDEVIRVLQKKNDLIWILWGNYARSYKSKITSKNHYIIEGVHPSPLAGGKFFGGKYFSECNRELEARNKTKIIW
jgi:uracil-DNA glycosylase